MVPVVSLSLFAAKTEQVWRQSRRCLRNDREATAETGPGDAGRIDAIDGDCALRHQQAVQREQHRGFSTPLECKVYRCGSNVCMYPGKVRQIFPLRMKYFGVVWLLSKHECFCKLWI